MNKLTPEQKLHIVYQLACFVSPTALVKEMKDLFEVEVTTSGVLAYDPTTAQGRKLSTPLRQEFEKAREQYVSGERNVAVAHRRYRLQYLQEILESPNVKRNPAMALKIMEHIEKAQGGMFTRSEPSARSGKEAQSDGGTNSDLLGEMDDDELNRRIAEAEARKLRRLYQTDPELYANQVLKVQWWSKQVEVAKALLKHKRVLVRASHSVGKSFLGGGLVDWFFDVYRPSITLTTAPTKAGVVDILWKEVRMQRGNRPGLQPKAPRMQTTPEHFAAGYTARDGNAFQGRHEEKVFILFDEAVGISAPFWDAAEGMMTGEDCYWLAIMNPTDTATRAYEEEQSGDWHVIQISALDHPNIAADLAGLPAPFPKAVRLAWLKNRIERWCTPIAKGDQKAADFEFPPGSGQWYRPGPLFEGRVIGRWPTNSGTSVWSEAMWQACLVWTPEPAAPLEIGCDVAIYGEDYTSIVVRRGRCVLHHETHNGWDAEMIAGRLKQLAKEFARKPEPIPTSGPALQQFAFPSAPVPQVTAGEDPSKIAIKVDDVGIGGRVMEHAKGWNFIGINASNTAHEPDEYPNVRSELWFTTAELADKGGIDVSRLSAESKSLIRRQVMGPKWKLNSAGQRVVEPKEETKKRIGRSPDDADGFNLAFAQSKKRRTMRSL